MLSLIFVAVVCTLTFLYYHKLWNLMQPQKQPQQPKLFQFVDESETEIEDLSPEHTLISSDLEEEEESIFYL